MYSTNRETIWDALGSFLPALCLPSQSTITTPSNNSRCFSSFDHVFHCMLAALKKRILQSSQCMTLPDCFANGAEFWHLLPTFHPEGNNLREEEKREKEKME
ncbi:hypothetical protein CEXT_428721 [Caerostris extrusa]|uniref:Uncharacterized protein n=1 Tax=Caerostris extrusa TaxID=172846 RepID=A0AAV4MYS6_CAEEX|nr:hypothetical protein CEXT_428721 [Caerostris extrusa]